MTVQTLAHSKRVSLGNRNYKGGDIALVDLAGGLQQIEVLLDEFDSAVLMCACRDAGRCHRRLVADEASRQLGLPTVELRPLTWPQMTLFDKGSSA